MMSKIRSLYAGTFAHSGSLEKLEFLFDSVVGVDEEGTIRFIEEKTSPEKVIKQYDLKDVVSIGILRG